LEEYLVEVVRFAKRGVGGAAEQKLQLSQLNFTAGVPPRIGAPGYLQKKATY
jgi:hypothetical protein